MRVGVGLIGRRSVDGYGSDAYRTHPLAVPTPRALLSGTGPPFRVLYRRYSGAVTDTLRTQIPCGGATVLSCPRGHPYLQSVTTTSTRL
jgi:hypothetical protein